MEEHKLNPEKIKRFMAALAASTKKIEQKSAARNDIKKQIDIIKKLSFDKRSTKLQMEYALNNLEEKIMQVVKDEKTLLDEQKEETKMLFELRKKIDELNNRLQQVEGGGAEQAQEKGQEQGQDSAKDEDGRRMKEIEEKINQKQIGDVGANKNVREEEIKNIAAQLAMLEKKHAELARSGEHPASALLKLKEIIETHKKSLGKLRGDVGDVPKQAPPLELKKIRKSKTKKTTGTMLKKIKVKKVKAKTAKKSVKPLKSVKKKNSIKRKKK